jgi:hypothetical protein
VDTVLPTIGERESSERFFINSNCSCRNDGSSRFTNVSARVRTQICNAGTARAVPWRKTDHSVRNTKVAGSRNVSERMAGRKRHPWITLPQRRCQHRFPIDFGAVRF